MEVIKKAKEKSVSKEDDGIELNITFNYDAAPAPEILSEIMNN